MAKTKLLGSAFAAVQAYRIELEKGAALEKQGVSANAAAINRAGQAAKAAIDKAQAHFADWDRRAASPTVADKLKGLKNVFKDKSALDAERARAKTNLQNIRQLYNTVEVGVSTLFG
jgi:hypothetical protein